MSEERPINTPSGETKTLSFDELNDDQLEQELALVLYRGQVNSRLDVPLPPGVHGEWVPDDPLEISRKQALGFKIDTEYALANKLHSDGTGKPKVGDVIYMTCSKRVKEVIDKIAQQKYLENNGVKRREKDQLEEKGYKTNIRQLGHLIADEKITNVNSSAEVIDGQAIAAAKAASQNLNPNQVITGQ